MREFVTYEKMFQLRNGTSEAINIRAPYPYGYGNGKGAFVVNIITNYSYTDAFDEIFYDNTIDDPHDSFSNDMEPRYDGQFDDAFYKTRPASQYGFKDQILIGDSQSPVLRLETRGDSFFAIASDGEHEAKVVMYPNQPINKVCVSWDTKRIYITSNGTNSSNTVHNGKLDRFGSVPVGGISKNSGYDKPVTLFQFSPRLFSPVQMKDVTRIIRDRVEFFDVFDEYLVGESLFLDGLRIEKSLDAFGNQMNIDTYEFSAESFSAKDSFGESFDLADI